MAPSPSGLQAEILKAARKGQEFVGHAIRTSTGKVRSVTPQQLHLPLADKLPTPDQVAGNVRGITARLPRPDDLARRLPKPGELAGHVRGMAARLPKREQLPANARNIAARLPKREELTGSARHMAGRLPKPEELAGSAASLASRLLASQRKFADQVLRVTTPQLPGKRHPDKNGPATGGATQSGAGPSQDGQDGTEDGPAGFAGNRPA